MSSRREQRRAAAGAGGQLLKDEYPFRLSAMDSEWERACKSAEAGLRPTSPLAAFMPLVQAVVCIGTYPTMDESLARQPEDERQPKLCPRHPVRFSSPSNFHSLSPLPGINLCLRMCA